MDISNNNASTEALFSGVVLIYRARCFVSLLCEMVRIDFWDLGDVTT